MLVTAAKLTQTDLLARAAQSKIPQLIVIPYSHYCELAVWALARRQQRDLPCGNDERRGVTG